MAQNKKEWTQADYKALHATLLRLKLRAATHNGAAWWQYAEPDLVLNAAGDIVDVKIICDLCNKPLSGKRYACFGTIHIKEGEGTCARLKDPLVRQSVAEACAAEGSSSPAPCEAGTDEETIEAQREALKKRGRDGQQDIRRYGLDAATQQIIRTDLEMFFLEASISGQEVQENKLQLH